MVVEGLSCILLVDDDDATNFIHERIIRSSGLNCHIEVCTSARDALDFLSCTGDHSTLKAYPRPGIIFLDINMPGMSGWDFLEAYESLPEEQQSRIILSMLTTSLNPDDADRAKNHKHLKDFLQKPLTVEMLRKIIKEQFE
ncbi:MAG: response regulator [Bacteroidota bacterium]